MHGRNIINVGVIYLNIRTDSMSIQGLYHPPWHFDTGGKHSGFNCIQQWEISYILFLYLSSLQLGLIVNLKHHYTPQWPWPWLNLSQTPQQHLLSPHRCQAMQEMEDGPSFFLISISLWLYVHFYELNETSAELWRMMVMMKTGRWYSRRTLFNGFVRIINITLKRRTFYFLWSTKMNADFKVSAKGRVNSPGKSLDSWGAEFLESRLGPYFAEAN